MQFVATCLFGLEKFVGDDIEKMGWQKLETIDGRVVFEAPDSAIAESNINFRYAERVMIKLGSFPATTFTELFDGVKSLEWNKFIGKTDAFPVKGHSVKSKLFSIPDCQSIVKKAVVESLKSKYNISFFEESSAKYQIVFFILNDVATLMIDTSGESLHKRGYRTEANIAPIRETLAAAMVSLSRPREDVLFVDPMCGSGTIPIEAALIATNTAPGLNRSFACEEFAYFDKKIFLDAREKAKSLIRKTDMKIYGFDNDADSITLSKSNALRAGVFDIITFELRDATKFTSPIEGARGTIVSNPPYGERMSDKPSVAILEQQLGESLAKSVPSWQLYFISSDLDFE
ncbi:MAG: class I SAM-dependent RNA methyltransferase, partial [Clostridia bacterium]